MPVNVLGKDGRPFTGLAAVDFELYDNGKRQEISGFQVVDLSRPPVETSNPVSEPPPPAARRHWLLAFDLSYSSLTSLLRARAGASSFIEKGMGPFDLAGVATLSIDQGWKLLENFTSDRLQLAHAIDTLGIVKQGIRTNDPLGFAFTRPGEEVASSEDADFQDLLRKSQDQYERGRIAQHLKTLGEMAQVLDSVRGRKYVLLFSEGFESRLLMGNAGKFGTPLGQRDATQDNAPENVTHGQVWKVDSDARFGSSATRSFLEKALSVFRRADVVLDTVDISGLRAGGEVTRRAGTGTDVLFTMASETNGDFIRNANELSGDLKKLIERTDLVYILAFQPKNLSNPGSFHELRVKVRVPTSHIACRSGYYEPRPYRNLTPVERMLASGDLLTSGGVLAQLPVHMLVAPFAADGKVAQVPVILEIGGSALLGSETTESSQLQIYAYASDANGTLADYVTQEVSLNLKKLRGKLEAGGLRYYGTLFLPPGRYMLHALVRQATSGLSTLSTASVVVPAIPGGEPTVLPPFFLDPTQASSWVMVRSDPRKGPSAAYPDYPFEVQGNPFLPAAFPVVVRGSVTQVAVVTFNLGASEGSQGIEPLQLTARVVGQDRKQRSVDVEVLHRTDGERNGARSVLLSLRGDRLEPGLYTLIVSVSVPASQRAAQAESLFEVRLP